MKISAIICAYNEENTIINLLIDVCCIQIFDEVIVVNDGSEDKTGLFIKEFKTRFELNDIHLLNNCGKGYAMASGIKAAKYDCIITIDADLSNFTSKHAKQLVNPIINNKADMVLGQPSETLLNESINPFLNLTGQRSFKINDVTPIIDKIKASRYGVETLLNMYFKANKKRITHVNLQGLIHPTKFEKTGPRQAISEFILEGYQIIKSTILNFNLKAQCIKNSFIVINKINN